MRRSKQAEAHDKRLRLKLALTDPELSLALAEAGGPWPAPQIRLLARDLPPPTPGFLANPNGEGYGRQWQWPFNHRWAVQLPSYRKGVQRAIHNPAFASNWRYEAAQDMAGVMEWLADLEATYWDIMAEEFMIEQD